MPVLLTVVIVFASIAGSAQTAYITNSISNSVTVVDVATNIVTAAIPVGNSPQGVTVSMDGNHVYVTNFNDNTVSVINTATNSVSATIPVGLQPYGISVSPNGSKVYVTNFGDTTVSVINTTTNTVSATVPVGYTPYGISVSPDGNKVYVANQGSNSVSVINTITDIVIATISLGIYMPDDVCISPDGNTIYVSDSPDITPISTTNYVVSNPIFSNGSMSYFITISPDGSKLYVADGLTDSLFVINTANNAVLASIGIEAQPEGISISPDGYKIYIPQGVNTIDVVNTLTYILTDTIGNPGTGSSSFGNFISTYPHHCLAFYTTSYDSTLNTFTLNVDSITSALATSYHWDFGDGTTSTLATPTHIYSQDTLYNVCMKIYTASGDSCSYCHTIGFDSLGNVVRTAGFMLNVINNSTVNVPTISKENTITLSPNPTTSSLTIQTEGNKIKEVYIYNVIGECVLAQQLTTNNQQLIIDVSGLKNGMYFAEVSVDTEASKTNEGKLRSKFIKQ